MFNCRQYSPLLNPKETSSTSGQKERNLNDIMKIDLIKDKDATDIKQIWEEYHIQKDVIAATIPSKTYEKIANLSNKYPMFILPLPRSQGFEFFMLQFVNNTIHFTPLICYQVINYRAVLNKMSSRIMTSIGQNFNVLALLVLEICFASIFDGFHRN